MNLKEFNKAKDLMNDFYKHQKDLTKFITTCESDNLIKIDIIKYCPDPGASSYYDTIETIGDKELISKIVDLIIEYKTNEIEKIHENLKDLGISLDDDEDNDA